MTPLFDVYIKNYMNGSTKVTSETKMLTIPVVSDNPQYINKPIVKLDWSSTGTFDFEVEPKSPFYNSFMHLRTIIRVDYDGDTIFRGRVLTIGNTLWGTRKIKCEDQYGFFRDGQREGVADEKRQVINLSTYIRGLIDDYNRQMADDPDKKFYVGEIPGNYSASIAEDQKCPDINEKFGSSSWQEVKSCLDDVGSGYGGHWRVRYTGGKAYLDLLKNYFRANVNSQAIELSKNILDLNNDYQVDNIFTIVIPLGASESKTSNGNTTSTVTTTISGYNTDLHEGNYIKVPDLVNIFTPAELNSGYHTLEDYRDAIDKYGTIFKTVSFSNADSPALLWSYATDWIKNNYLGVVRDFSIKVVDFHQLSQTPTYSEHASTQKYMVGDRVRVIYPVFINGEKQMRTEIMTIKGISYDLYNPENTMLTIGIPSDLLDHEYGQKKTKAKKTKGDNTTAPVPSGSGGNTRKKVHVHKWIRDTISNYTWGGATLKSVSTYHHDTLPVKISSLSTDRMPTYRVAYYTGMDGDTYGVALNRTGFFVYNVTKGNVPVKWLGGGATADGDHRYVTIQGVTFDLDTEMAYLLELCKIDNWVEVSKDREATLDGGILTTETPSGASVTVIKANLHRAIKDAVTSFASYGNKQQIYSTYTVIKPAQNAGHGYERIAKFTDIHGTTQYIVFGKAGCGISVTGQVTSDDGEGILRWIARTDDNGKLTIGNYTYDVNTDWKTLQDLAAEDKDADITIRADSVSLGDIGVDENGDPLPPEVELSVKDAMAKIGRDANGDWLIKLNDVITYTDADGNERTLNGFISAQDLNLPEIPSFKTKIAQTDVLIADKAYMKELHAVEATIGDASSKSIVYNPDGTVKSVSFDGTQFQVNARHAVAVSGSFEVDPENGDLTVISGGAFSIKRDETKFGIWDKGELSAGIFVSKGPDGLYSEIRGDHVRIGTDSTSDNILQATTIYGQVVGEYEWNIDPKTGRKTTPKGIKEGVGVWSTKNNRAEGIWHKGELSAGMFVSEGADGTYSEIRGDHIRLGTDKTKQTLAQASEEYGQVVGTYVWETVGGKRQLKGLDGSGSLVWRNGAAYGIWDKGELSAGMFVSKGSDGLYTEIRGDHIRLGTDKTKQTLAQASEEYGQVVGTYVWETINGKKYLKGLDGSGSLIWRNGAAYGIWDKGELSAGIFVSKGSDGTYSEIRGDRVRIGTDKTKQTLAQASEEYGQVVGTYVWETVGGKRQLKGLDGSGSLVWRDGAAYGIWDKGNLTGGVLVEKINDGTTTTHIKGTRVVLGTLDDKDLDDWATDAKNGQGVFTKFLTVRRLKASEIETLLASIGDAEIGSIDADEVSVRGDLGVVGDTNCLGDCIADSFKLQNELTLNVVDISISGNTMTIYYADGTQKDFSKATSLKGTWSGSVLSVKASPQGETFKIGMGNVTADVHLGVETGTASVYKNSEGVENKNIISLPLYVNSTEKNSQGIETQTRRYTPSPATVYITDLRETKSITSNGTYTPSDKKLGFSSVSVNITSSIDGSWSGKTYTVTSNPGSKKKTIGFAGTENVVLSITHDANATIYKNSSGVENKNYVQIQAYAKSTEKNAQGVETETTRYTPSKSTIGISSLMETKSISSDGTYTPSEGKIGFSSITVDAEANGKTTGWNLARGKVTIPGQGSGTSIIAKWPGSDYNTQVTRTYEFYDDTNNIVKLRYNSATSGTPSYVYVAQHTHNKYNAGYVAGWNAARAKISRSGDTIYRPKARSGIDATTDVGTEAAYAANYTPSSHSNTRKASAVGYYKIGTTGSKNDLKSSSSTTTEAMTMIPKADVTASVYVYISPSVSGGDSYNASSFSWTDY